MVATVSMSTSAERTERDQRYARQMILPVVGEAGQERLRCARVLVVGAGALGSPVLQYLTGAGVGQIELVDADAVALHNLHRQILYTESDVGQAKARVAARRLQALNSEVQFHVHTIALNPRNAADWVAQADVVIDCADSFAVTYTLSDECCRQNTPYISASVLGLSGYVGGFCSGAPSVRALFDAPPQSAASCSSSGVLAPVAGMVASLQAQMALAVVLDLQPSPLGQMVTMDGAQYQFRSFRFDDAPEPDSDIGFPFIALSDVSQQDYVIDLRAADEILNEAMELRPAAPCQVQRMSAQELRENGLPAIAKSARLVLCCTTGLRAWRVARSLSAQWQAPIVLLSASGERVFSEL